MAKRLFDLFFSFLGLVLTSPVLVVIAALIKLGSKGPVFYRGERVGKDGKVFKIFKFRTMVVDAEKLGGSSTSNDDPRITGIGRRLRRFKLDELPQLINVFKGDMSFVGPRPEVKYYTDQFSEEEKAILSVRPGITDWASIRFSDEGGILAGHDDPDKAYEELIRPNKIRLQLEYIKRRNLWIDLKIILTTIRAILFGPPESMGPEAGWSTAEQGNTNAATEKERN